MRKVGSIKTFIEAFAQYCGLNPDDLSCSLQMSTKPNNTGWPEFWISGTKTAFDNWTRKPFGVLVDGQILKILPKDFDSLSQVLGLSITFKDIMDENARPECSYTGEYFRDFTNTKLSFSEAIELASGVIKQIKGVPDVDYTEALSFYLKHYHGLQIQPMDPTLIATPIRNRNIFNDQTLESIYQECKMLKRGDAQAILSHFILYYLQTWYRCKRDGTLKMIRLESIYQLLKEDKDLAQPFQIDPQLIEKYLIKRSLHLIISLKALAKVQAYSCDNFGDWDSFIAAFADPVYHRASQYVPAHARKWRYNPFLGSEYPKAEKDTERAAKKPGALFTKGISTTLLPPLGRDASLFSGRTFGMAFNLYHCERSKDKHIHEKNANYNAQWTYPHAPSNSLQYRKKSVSISHLPQLYAKRSEVREQNEYRVKPPKAGVQFIFNRLALQARRLEDSKGVSERLLTLHLMYRTKVWLELDFDLPVMMLPPQGSNDRKPAVFYSHNIRIQDLEITLSGPHQFFVSDNNYELASQIIFSSAPFVCINQRRNLAELLLKNPSLKTLGLVILENLQATAFELQREFYLVSLLSTFIQIQNRQLPPNGDDREYFKPHLVINKKFPLLRALLREALFYCQGPEMQFLYDFLKRYCETETQQIEGSDEIAEKLIKYAKKYKNFQNLLTLVKTFEISDPKIYQWLSDIELAKLIEEDELDFFAILIGWFAPHDDTAHFHKLWRAAYTSPSQRYIELLLCSPYQKHLNPLQIEEAIYHAVQHAKWDIVKLLYVRLPKNYRFRLNYPHLKNSSCLHFLLDIFSYSNLAKFMDEISLSLKNSDHKTPSEWLLLEEYSEGTRELIALETAFPSMHQHAASMILALAEESLEEAMKCLDDAHPEFTLDKTLCTPRGDNLLTLAVAHSETDMIQNLISRGFCPFENTQHGKNAFDLCNDALNLRVLLSSFFDHIIPKVSNEEQSHILAQSIPVMIRIIKLDLQEFGCLESTIPKREGFLFDQSHTIAGRSLAAHAIKLRLPHISLWLLELSNPDLIVPCYEYAKKTRRYQIAFKITEKFRDHFSDEERCSIIFLCLEANTLLVKLSKMPKNDFIAALATSDADGNNLLHYALQSQHYGEEAIKAFYKHGVLALPYLLKANKRGVVPLSLLNYSACHNNIHLPLYNLLNKNNEDITLILIQAFKLNLYTFILSLNYNETPLNLDYSDPEEGSLYHIYIDYLKRDDAHRFTTCPLILGYFNQQANLLSMKKNGETPVEYARHDLEIFKAMLNHSRHASQRHLEINFPYLRDLLIQDRLYEQLFRLMLKLQPQLYCNAEILRETALRILRARQFKLFKKLYTDFTFSPLNQAIEIFLTEQKDKNSLETASNIVGLLAAKITNADIALAVIENDHIRDQYLPQVSNYGGIRIYLSLLSKNRVDLASKSTHTFELSQFIQTHPAFGTALHYSVSHHLVDMSLFLLGNLALLAIEHNGISPLELAIKSGNPDILLAIREKLKRNPDILPISLCNRALLLACERQQWPMALILANRGGENLKSNSEGKTALHYAAEFGQVELAELLIKKHKADPTQKDQQHFSALNYADELLEPWAMLRALKQGLIVSWDLFKPEKKEAPCSSKADSDEEGDPWEYRAEFW